MIKYTKKMMKKEKQKNVDYDTPWEAQINFKIPVPKKEKR